MREAITRILLFCALAIILYLIGFGTPNWLSSQKTLAVVGIITFIVIGWQAWETRRAADSAAQNVEFVGQQIVIMKRQTTASEDSAKAAKRSAEAANTNVEIVHQ